MKAKLNTRVRVVVRLRPVVGERAIKVTGRESLLLATHGTRQYLFDEVLDETATQSETTAACCATAVDAVLAGRNGLIMAYGPTGTGKVCRRSRNEIRSYSLSCATNLQHWELNNARHCVLL